MKKYIIGFLAGLFLSGITAVFAANYLYHADEVSYTPRNSNWNVDSVDKAIDELYSKVNENKVVLLGKYSANTTIDVSSYGAKTIDSFLVVTNSSASAAKNVEFPTWVNSKNTVANASFTSPKVTVSEESNGIITKIKFTVGKITATGTTSSYSGSASSNIAGSVYYVG